MTDSNERYEMQIEIQQSDIDELGHVNNVVYLRWVQDVAVAHWRAAASPQAQEKYWWVVTRHEIDYKRPTFAHDDVVAVTWVGTASARSFERHTELLRGSDRKLLAKARTLWCPIDSQTGRPTDVNDEVRERFSSRG